MAYLHFCGGDRGGVGKTLFCKTLVGYYEEIGREVTVFDTDRANQDMYKIRKDGDGLVRGVRLERSLFSDNPEYEDEPDRILYEALEGKDVIVNLPAGATLNVTSWWERCGGTELCKEHKIEVTHWFLTGGDHVHLVKNSTRRFLVPHVVVKNEHLRTYWQVFDDSLEFLKLEQIVLMRLGRQLADMVSVGEMLLHDCLGSDSLRILERQKLRYFIDEMGRRLVGTGRVPVREGIESC